jgi:hypothetical protein
MLTVRAKRQRKLNGEARASQLHNENRKLYTVGVKRDVLPSVNH